MSSEPLKNPRHEIFAQLVAKGATQAEAYRKAYPKQAKGKDATIHPKASRLAAGGKVRARVLALQQAMARESEIEGARVLKEAAALAFSDVRLLFDEQGRLRPPSEWPAAIVPAVASVKVKPEYEYEGGKRHFIGNSYEVRLWDKNAALEKLFKNKGLFEQDNKQTRTSIFDGLSPQEQMQLREIFALVDAGVEPDEAVHRVYRIGSGGTPH